MDQAELKRLKTLAVDTIIAHSVHSEETKLAEALESVVDELANDSPPHCSTCSCGVSKCQD